MKSDDTVILVDEGDRQIGLAPKLAAHLDGARHRAISVCIVDSGGRMLLQRRAPEKYHSGGLWTNACCTHPRPGERTDQSARRRLREELGIACPLRFVARIHYRAEVGGGLVEDEIVHLFVGDYDGEASPDPREVADVAWRSYEDLIDDIAAKPDAYTYWFRYYMTHFGRKLFTAPLSAA
ncbi:isopentenyl-diphosphate delta-isomerase [Roseiarcus fermentans]|uniref:Isopentenyl-diphosphate Delta-isomerase n=1 Tax=Roseiarcus fermentans TaxID=1473586 RepID=A0A366FC39_9HYPH|nr:isopentenyl-diphosphate Delta-isomerase [Roseiarcus fermentans]RBP11319.1 isopentenyl-diphosphate delta-isomerase [Roseiarcus fermentans]